MSDLVSKYIELAMSTALMVLLLAAVSFFVHIGSQAASAYQRKQDSMFRLQEHAKYAEYDGTIVSGADAISCIYRFASDSSVVVMQRDVRVFVGGAERFSNESIAVLESVIDPVGTYNANIQMNVNGAVESIRFH